MKRLLSAILLSIMLITSFAEASTLVDSKKEVHSWFAMLQTALKNANFDAGIIVTMQGNNPKSYRWLHGKLPSGLEVESVASLIGDGSTIIRHDNRVSYIENDKDAYSVTASSIRKFIPSVFYQDVNILNDSYQFVAVSKSEVAGRITQLIRIESRQKESYNYWVWIDEQTGLPLRMAYVDENGDIAEQTLMTHLRMLTSESEELKNIANMTLPEPATEQVAAQQEMNSWQLTWLPNGFEVIKSDRHHIPMSREVSDYFLLSDGLVEFSIYIQRPLDSFESPIALREGATSFVMHRANGFDVTVVGTIPVGTALKIAQSVKSKS
jgi:sigma-E factor negative regulatory protein RseB